MEGYLIALAVLAVWFIVLIAGWKLKFWEKIHLSVYGPFLMMKTLRGRSFLDKLSRPKRFWKVYGKISIWVCIGSMISLMVLLIWEAFIVLDIPATAAPAPEMILGLPGLNPIIPLWYGILGLVVGIVIHEMAHGITSRSLDVKVESMGLIFLIFPMGAFVEPNEAELRAATTQKRSWIFAVGPTTNVIAAFLCLGFLTLVMAPAIQPASEGAIVTGVTTDSPALHSGISVWSEITSIGGIPIRNASDVNDYSFDNPGGEMPVDVLYRQQASTKSVPGGIVITSVSGGLPAFSSGVRPGMIFHSLNGTVIHSLRQLSSVIENESHDVSLNITMLSYGFNETSGTHGFIRNTSVTNITLTSKWLYYFTYYPNQNREEYRNKSFMGIGSSVLGVAARDSEYIKQVYASPFGEADGSIASGFLMFIGMPFRGLTPVEAPITDLYVPAGALSFLPADVFWVLFNSIYWIFWINLMVGLTNALPAVPLDGGYVFKDLLKGLIRRLKKIPDGGLDKVVTERIAEDQLDRVIGLITIIISFAVLFLIVWQIIGPRL